MKASHWATLPLRAPAEQKLHAGKEEPSAPGGVAFTPSPDQHDVTWATGPSTPTGPCAASEDSLTAPASDGLSLTAPKWLPHLPGRGLWTPPGRSSRPAGDLIPSTAASGTLGQGAVSCQLGKVWGTGGGPGRPGAAPFGDRCGGESGLQPAERAPGSPPLARRASPT